MIEDYPGNVDTFYFYVHSTAINKEEFMCEKVYLKIPNQKNLPFLYTGYHTNDNKPYSNFT